MHQITPPDPLHAPIADRDSAHAAIAAVMARVAQAGATVRPAPDEPVGCCGRGCEGCVWLGWFGALARWRSAALEAVAAAGGGTA